MPMPLARLVVFTTTFMAGGFAFAGSGVAQDVSFWRYPASGGYGGAGVGIALGLTWEESTGTTLSAAALGAAAGMTAGWLLGRRADESLASGLHPTAGTAMSVRAGTVLAGATAGALASAAVIGFGDRPDDERLFTTFTLGGAALGIVTQLMWESRLRPGGSGVALMVAPMSRGRIQLGFQALH